MGEKFSSKVAFVSQPSFVPGRGNITHLEETANRAVIDVETEGQNFLVMSVTPHKYWRIFIDGVRVPAIITNIGYQGVVVGSGKHHIEMRYQNELILMCLAISVFTALVMIAIAIFSGRRDYPSLEAYEEPVHVVTDASGQHVEPVAS
jgi:uncharacterized membrane protein YfhO